MRSWRREIGSGLLVLTLCAGHAVSGEGETSTPPEDIWEVGFEELVNMKIQIASSGGDTIFTTPSTVTLIDRETIRHLNLRSVAEAIALVPGMAVLRTYIKYDIPTARGILEDHYANKVLVMIDGVPTWNAVTGEGSLDRIDISAVDRIEILKGPASVLYGTNAYAGAVNIILRKSESSRIFSHMGAGVPQRYNAGADLTWAREKLSLLASGHLYLADQDEFTFKDEVGTVGTVSDRLRSGNVTVELRSPQHTLLLNAYTFQDPYLGVTPRFSEGAGREHDTSGQLLSYTFSYEPHSNVLIRAGTAHDWNTRDLSRVEDDRERSSIEGYRASGFLDAGVSLTDGLSLETGAAWDYRRSIRYNVYDPQTEAVLSENNMRNRSVNEYSFFSQASLRRGSLSSVIGARFTRNDLFGWNTRLRGTIVHALGASSSLKVIYGQSYRAPSLFELYFETPGATVLGNVDLHPETSASVEVAYLTTVGRLFVQALGYHARYENKIQRARVGEINTYINGDAFSANGIEIETRYHDPEGTEFFANYSYVDGDNGDLRPDIEPGHYNFKYVPRHRAAVGLVQHHGAFFASSLLTYVSSTHGPLDRVRGQALVDLNLGYRARAGDGHVLQVLSIKNVFDGRLSVPEYARRRGLNDVPFRAARAVTYTVSIELPF